MAFSIRTRNVATPRPTVGGPGARPFVTAVSNSVAAIATVMPGQWSGPRQTFAYQWYRGTGAANTVGSMSGFTEASASIQSAGTLQCDVTVTNSYGSRTVRSLPIVVA